MQTKSPTPSETKPAKVKPQSRVAVVRDILGGEEFLKKIDRLIPDHITPERFINMAQNAVTKNPKLAECELTSLFQCLIDCCAFGIEVDGRRAYLIPRNNRRKQIVECTVTISYMGLIELCKRNGDVQNVRAHRVYENDNFRLQLGSDARIEHSPVLNPDKQGEPIGCYAIVDFKNGSQDFEFMNHKEIQEIAMASPGYKDGPWQNFAGEMEKKTVIRRLLKRHTLSPKVRDAMDRDDDKLPDVGYSRKAELAKPVAAENPFPVSAAADETDIEPGTSPESDSVSEEEVNAAFDNMTEKEDELPI